MKYGKETNFIFDFDGTIADLEIDWPSLKREVNKLCRDYGIESNQPLNQKIDKIKQIDTSVLELVKAFEQENNTVTYTPKLKTLAIISLIDEFYIISNNLESTILWVLSELGLEKKCKKIVAIDTISESKPARTPYLSLQSDLSYPLSIYIGDRDSDREFAENCKINFIWEKDLCKEFS